MHQKRMLFYQLYPESVKDPKGQPMSVAVGMGSVVAHVSCPKYGMRTCFEKCLECEHFVAEHMHFIECSLELSKKQMDQMTREAMKNMKATNPHQVSKVFEANEIPPGVFNG